MNKKETNLFSANVFKKLHDGSISFSPQQKRICLFFIQHYKDTIFMTINELAHTLDAGVATILRTINKLGYQSYKDFISDLRKNVINQDSTYWHELRSSWKAGQNNPSANLLAQITQHNIDSLEKSYSPALVNSFDNCIKQLKKAKVISILGLRSSRALSYYMFFLLDQFMPNVHLTDAIDSAEIFNMIAKLNKNDVFFVFSLGGPNYTVRTFDAIRYAATQKVPIILVADSPANPAVQYASTVLYITATSTHYSMLPALNLVDAIIAKMGNPKSLSRMLDLTKVLVNNKIIVK